MHRTKGIDLATIRFDPYFTATTMMWRFHRETADIQIVATHVLNRGGKAVRSPLNG
ncbi:MAG: hypothetical protein VKN72_01015 [Nostocales cyanobacterium 94392]|nr:hypothetical protein [Nostocales cyanobacterium 94392]